MALIKFQNQDKFFIKFFLLDASLNLNRWGVTETALKNNLNTFLEKPFVLTPGYDHPNAANGDDLFVQQEKYRVGDIIQVGIDETTGKAFGVAEIFDKTAAEVIKNGDVNFVSPSIVFNSTDEIRHQDSSIIVNFEGAHVAAVADPAYGIMKAEIKGKCAGDADTCHSQLQKVQASRSSCGKYLTVKSAGKTMTVANRECVKACIEAKSEAGETIDDQALAICYSECYDNKEGTIDQDSLDNITKVDMLKKKKKEEADHMEVTSPRKRKGPVKNNAKKAKDQKEEDEDYEVQMQSFDKDNTSVKGKHKKKSNNMKRRNANDDDKEKKESEEEEKKEHDASDENSFEEQYKEKKEKDIIEGEEKEEEDAEDENKLDLTDKQEKYLKDKEEGSLKAQVKTLKAEIKTLKAKFRKAEVEPIIDSILEAKSKIGSINVEAEYAKLSKLDTATLTELADSYKGIVEAKASPRYSVKYASTDSSVKGDEILRRIRGDMS